MSKYLLAKMAFTALIIGSSINAHSNYAVCRDRADQTLFIQCSGHCPLGSDLVSYSPNSHPRCVNNSHSNRCPNIISMGWRGGHKNNFCRNRGFHGVIAAAECRSRRNYGDGGWCFRPGDYQNCRYELGCH